MRSHCNRNSVLLILFGIVTISIGYSNNERLSSGFVLETSESTSTESAEQPVPATAAIVIKYNINNNNNDPTTKIITDSGDGPDSSYSNSNSHNESKQYSSPDRRPSKSYSSESSNVRKEEDNAQSDEQVTSISNRGSNNKQTERLIGGKRIKDENQMRSATSQQQQYYPNTNAQQRIASSTTTSRPLYNNDNNSNSAPKTEERLLISISANDDDDYRPPRNNNNSNNPSGGVNNHNHHQNHNDNQPAAVVSSFNPNKKPSITISIQDGSANKQQGGHTSAVIVRPGEDGQSIVIATVAQNHNIIKPNGPHPTSNSGLVNNNNNNHQQPPYREPVNPHPYPPSTTTYRPALNEYQPPANSRPVNVEQPQKPPRPLNPHTGPTLATTDERPHRPNLNELDNTHNLNPNSGYEGPSNNNNANRPISNNNLNNNNNNEPLEEGKGIKYPLNERNCGLIHETRIVGGEVANPDDFLWMAAIIKSKPKEGDERPFCGGSLITRRHILTAAHCLENLTPRDVLVRLGSYDFDEFTASSLSADYAIDQFRTPAQYNKKTHVADIAIMRLKTPIAATDNYKTVCMPQTRRSYVGALGTVTGYGSQSSSFRRAAPTLRQVTVPIWENRKCSVVYQKNLTESFLCAGYEEGGKDACQGDSGGPLMTEGPNDRMMVVGIVSHGIGCGKPNYPGVYTRTSTFLDWIEKNTRE